MKNFWQKLPRPIYALAPMAGVADSAFRQICKQFGADVVYSEMVSAAALAYGSKKTLELMKFSKKERPFVVQLFGAKPEHFAKAARLVEQKIKPDGLDINFGCPVKKVLRQGAGAILMENRKLAREIIEAVINNTNLPVSIKIRARVGQFTALDFLKYLAGLDIKAVMIHGRTMAQGQSGAVDWQIIKKARPLVKGVLLANGGVKSAADARDLLQKTGADGIGIGQGVLGRPWLFGELRMSNVECRIEYPKIKDVKEIFKVMLKHASLVDKLSAQGACPFRFAKQGGRGSASGGKGRQGIREMRKHLCWYVSGLPNAAALRQKLINVESFSDIKKILMV